MATLSITARTAGSAELIKTQALAILMPQRKTLSPALKALDKGLGGTMARSLQNGDFTGSAGSHMWLPGAGSGLGRRLPSELMSVGNPAISLVSQLGRFAGLFWRPPIRRGVVRSKNQGVA